nr:uncharacterized protein LOC115259282 [Aedes albopictus]
MWKKLELGTLDAVVTGDLKIINIVAGVMSNSSTYPCAFCTVNKKDLGEKFGTLRTIDSIQHNSSLWNAEGGIKNNAKFYLNCVNTPLFHGDGTTNILDVCAPPSLHLLLGMVNTVYNGIAECNDDIAQSWTAVSGATRHAQFGFTGRHCHNLLAKREILNDQDPNLKQYVYVLNGLQKVVDACFGVKLQDDFQQHIIEFCEAWKSAKLPRTPKFHTINIPCSNGAAENAVKTVKTALKKLSNDPAFQKKSTSIMISSFLEMYRASKHATTAESPFKLMFGREMRLRFDTLKFDATRRQDDTIQKVNNRKKQETFAVGETVYVRDYRNPKKASWIRGKILKKLGAVLFECSSEELGTIKRRSHQILKYPYDDYEEDRRISNGHCNGNNNDDADSDVSYVSLEDDVEDNPTNQPNGAYVTRYNRVVRPPRR